MKLRFWKFLPLISLLAALAAATLAGQYARDEVSELIEKHAENGQWVLSRQFTATLWQKYHSELRGGIAVPEFKEDMRQFLSDAAVTGFRLYSKRGLLIYSTGGTLSANEFAAAALASRASARNMAYDIVSPGGVKLDLPADQRSGTLLRGFAAIGTDEDPEGYIEVFNDISPLWARIQRLQWLTMAAVMAGYGLMLLVMTAIQRRSNATIGRLHEENVDLVEIAEKAQAESQEKSLFLANVSHELRTPLNAIIGFSEIIKTELLGEVQNQKYADYVHDIHNSGVHLLSLINDILDFTKAESGKLELEISEINAGRLVMSCVRLIAPRAEAGNVVLVNAMPKEPIAIETDSKKLKQVLLNLLSNAVKFTPPGGQVKVSCWRDVTTDSHVFEVADTGVGIAPKDIAKALSPFSQVDNILTKKYEGTGLGLPLARRFVETMGGRFGIQSEVGKGTTVTFSLPRVFRARDDVIVKYAAE